MEKIKHIDVVIYIAVSIFRNLLLAGVAIVKDENKAAIILIAFGIWGIMSLVRLSTCNEPNTK